MQIKPTVIFVLSFFSIQFFCTKQAFGYAGKVAYVQGDVTQKSKGQNSKVSQDSVITGGDTLMTGPQSIAILQMEDGAQLKLNEKSTLLIPLENEGSVTLASGSVFSKIPKQKPGHQFKVSTPTAVMGVRGTQFFTSYGADEEHAKDLWMCVNEGSVDVTNNASKKTVLVLAGQGILMPEKSDITAPQKYAWTKDLNWNLDPKKGNIENKIKIKYQKDLLKADYN
ncbi:MAG: FecR domain-containing protein [Bdellovibrionaceae bacterium]|nr:FecR domain-containing protein [Pseudobdellovibrionaceae bacterium]